jgi:hypothetical protein
VNSGLAIFTLELIFAGLPCLPAGRDNSRKSGAGQVKVYVYVKNQINGVICLAASACFCRQFVN